MRLWEQGDVLITMIDKLPLGDRKIVETRVLAEGEHTGHKHQIDIDEADIALADPEAEEILSPSVRVLKILDKLFVEAKRKWTLRHEEHKPITMPPGTYQVDIVRESCHLSGVVRRVAD